MENKEIIITYGKVLKKLLRQKCINKSMFARKALSEGISLSPKMLEKIQSGDKMPRLRTHTWICEQLSVNFILADYYWESELGFLE